MLQEARIWFDAVEEGAINIKDVDLVLLRTPMYRFRGQCRFVTRLWRR